MPWDKVFVSLYDKDFRIVWISSVIPPRVPEEVIGRRPWEFLDRKSSADFQAAALRVQVDNEPQTLELFAGKTGFFIGRLFPSDFNDIRCIGIYFRLPAELRGLTPREREICLMLANGKPSAEIADDLNIARSTVDNHRANIAGKLNIPTHALVAWCGRNEGVLQCLTEGCERAMVQR